MQKLVLGFLFGGICGALVVYLVFANPDADSLALNQAEIEARDGRILEMERALADANGEQRNLRAENARLKSGLAPVAVAAEGEATGEKDAGKGMAAFMKMAMAMGNKQEEKQVEARVAQLKVRLNLTDAQAEQVHTAMMDRLRAKNEATARIMEGKASVADLLQSDEDNFKQMDTAMNEILGDEQRAEYDAVRSEREVARVEKKTNEDMVALRKVANLSEEQKDQAWQVFVDINAANPPRDVPEGTTVEEVHEFVGGELGKRREGLGEILTPEQHAAYVEQLNAQQAFITKMIDTGVGGGD